MKRYEQLVARARLACGAKNDVELAKELHVTSAAVSKWKEKGISEDKLKILTDEKKVNPYWLNTGQGEMFENAEVGHDRPVVSNFGSDKTGDFKVLSCIDKSVCPHRDICEEIMREDDITEWKACSRVLRVLRVNERMYNRAYDEMHAIRSSFSDFKSELDRMKEQANQLAGQLEFLRRSMADLYKKD